MRTAVILLFLHGSPNNALHFIPIKTNTIFILQTLPLHHFFTDLVECEAILANNSFLPSYSISLFFSFQILVDNAYRSYSFALHHITYQCLTLHSHLPDGYVPPLYHLHFTHLTPNSYFSIVNMQRCHPCKHIIHRLSPSLI